MGLSINKRKSDENVQIAKLKSNVELSDHTEDLQKLFERLGVNPSTGLSSAEVNRLIKEQGPNSLTPPKQTPTWVKFLKELTGFFSLLLWGGAILCFIGYILTPAFDVLCLGITLCVVNIITGVFSFYQNNKSESLMNSFANMLPPKVKVIRNGGVTDEVPSINIVPGDIVLVEGGDLIPADMRVLECSDNFQVDNAALTGESEPQKRRSECTHEDPLETQNLCFFGTQIPEGSAKGVIIRTSDHTVMGRIAALAMRTKNEQTPINKEIHHFIITIFFLAMILGSIFFAMSLVIGTPLIQSLVFMIGVIVAIVPEGLLVTVTVCLTLAAKRMHAKMVLIKNLEGVETLGSTSCICSDKTGTLTQNIMTVAQIVYGNRNRFTVEDAPSSFTGGRKTYDMKNVCCQKLMRCATLCNMAIFKESSKWETEEDGETPKIDKNSGKPTPKPFQGYIKQGDGTMLQTIFWKPVGNASECAMIKLAQSEADPATGNGDIEMVRSQYPKKFVIPFNSANKYQVHIHKNKNDGKHLLQMKGAPERIISRCSHVMLNDQIVEMTAEEKKNIEDLQEELSRNGLRVLGFAEKELDPTIYNDGFKYTADDDKYFSPNFPLGDSINEETDKAGRVQNPACTEKLVFLGLMALIDPPRPAVPDAVEKCKTAGIKVIMVTGDHPVTAQAIAYKVGILWSKTRGDMERDNARFGRSPGDPDYENPDDALAIVVPGSDISVDMSEERWDFILGHTQVVFARTSPQQKLVIVENNQRMGHIVAVTGDGVNDSPAIKKADIGIAMGIMGSEVSKNAADMILLDDNFASIVKGIEEGRIIFDNLKKSISNTLSSKIPELLPFLAQMIFGIPLALTTFMILAIDLGTDMIPAISMAYELPESDIMKRPPRNSKVDRLVGQKLYHFSMLQVGMLQAFAGFYVFMIVLNDYGYPPHMLMNKGSNTAWGVKPLFCKFNGGNYVDIDGNINYVLNPSVDAPTIEYPFWFQGMTGYLEDCGYGLMNYQGDDPLTSDFDYQNSNTYSGGTRGLRVHTLEGILANEQKKYFRYIPWKAKTSMFWDNKYLYWDSNDQNEAFSIGKGVDSKLYFGGSQVGLWSICASQNNNLGNATDRSSIVRGIQIPDTAVISNPEHYSVNGEKLCSNSKQVTIGPNIYSNAVFCNGQSNDPDVCSSVNGYSNDHYGYPNNPHQAFYCKNQCGRVVEPDTIPFCNANNEVCTYGKPTKDCSKQCEDYCYYPSVYNETDFGAGINGYKQCVNIASNQVALETLRHSQAAFFGAIVAAQAAGVLICKTRWLSFITQGMRNDVMVFGICTEFFLVALLCYCLPINRALGTRNIRLVHWFASIPWCIFIFIFDECRKGIMRTTSPEKIDKATGQVIRSPGWAERNCAY